MLTTLAAAAALAIAADTVGPDDLARAYVEVVQVAPRGNSSRSPVLARVVDTGSLPVDHLLRPFLEDNGALFAYLVENAKAFDAADILEGDGTVEQKARRFHDALVADTTFRAIADPVVAAFLASEGHDVADAVATGRRDVSMERLQSVAVRFFYPDTMAPGGQFGGHICVGKNGNADARDRDLLLEAIAYSALMRDLMRDPRELSTRFRNALASAESLRLSTDPAIALARAQGVVWHYLQDDAFIRSLLDEYVRERSWLPVAIT